MVTIGVSRDVSVHKLYRGTLPQRCTVEYLQEERTFKDYGVKITE